MLNKHFILISVCLILSLIPFSSQQFSYSANWGKRSDSNELSENAEGNTLQEEKSKTNILDVLLSREEVIWKKNYHFMFAKPNSKFFCLKTEIFSYLVASHIG